MVQNYINSGSFFSSSCIAQYKEKPKRSGLIRILRCNALIRKRFLSAPLQAGHVHSVFERAVNLAWYDDALITLQGAGPLVAPFAAAVTHLPEIACEELGTPVWRHENRLFLGKFVLEVEGAALADTTIYETDEPPDPLVSWFAGFALSPVAPGLSSPTGDSARRRIVESIFNRNAQAFIEGAYALIGLGEGLTPAGDDCLVGILAILHRFAHSWFSRQQEIKHVIAAAARARTTTVGRDFILNAVDGDFSELIVRLITATSPDHAKSAAMLLMGRGATSGADFLSGVIPALQAVKGSYRIANQMALNTALG